MTQLTKAWPIALGVIFALVLSACLAPVSPTALPGSTRSPTVAISQVVALTSSPVPTATALPSGSSPSPLPTLASTPVTLGHLVAQVLIETHPIPGLACDSRELWLAMPPYDSLQPFLRSDDQSRRSPRWSNDGLRMAFIEESDGSSRVGTANQDGTEPRVIGPTFEFAQEGGFCNQLELASWSPSDEWLAFEYFHGTGPFYRHLYLLNAHTGEASLADENSYGFRLPTWSPSKDVLAYVAGLYDTPGYQLRQLSVKLLEVTDQATKVVDLFVPKDLDLNERRDQILDLAWQSDSQLLISVSPIIGDDPGRLYRVDTVSQVWELLAEYERNLATERHPPSTLAVSSGGPFLAWAGTDLVILDTSTWQEHSRLKTSWLEGPLMEWIRDSNGLPVLVYNNQNEFWLYEPQTATNLPLLAGPALSRDKGLVLEDADWKP